MKTAYQSMDANLEAYARRNAGFATMRERYPDWAKDYKRALRAIWLRWHRRGMATRSWAEVEFMATR